MDNKAKFLCIAIAVLLASNGYLLYRLGNAEGKTEHTEGETNESDSQESSVVGHYRFSTFGTEYTLYFRSDNVAEYSYTLADKIPMMRVGDWSLNNKEVVLVLPEIPEAISSTRYYRINGEDLIWIARRLRDLDRKHFAEKDFIRLKRIK